jgi:hypothetical protein
VAGQDLVDLAAMVELGEEAVVVALNLPLDTVVGHVLDLPTGVTSVLTRASTRPGRRSAEVGHVPQRGS